MKCKHCDASIDENVDFCPICGNKIEKDESVDNSKKINLDKIKNLAGNLKKLKDKINKDNFIIKFLDKYNHQSQTKGENIPDEDSKKTTEENSKIESDEYKLIEEKNLVHEDNQSDYSEDIVGKLFDDNQYIDLTEDNRYEVVDFDKYDRLSKTSRMVENLGVTKVDQNQKSTIEEVQEKIYKNLEKPSLDDDYYIDDEEGGINNDLEKKLNELMGIKSKERKNATLPSAIRQMQDKNKKLIRNRQLEPQLNKPTKEVVSLVDKENLDEKQTHEMTQKTEETKESPINKSIFDKFDFKKYINNKNMLLGLIILLVFVLGGLLYMKLSKPKDINISLSNYITVTYEGEDGKATPKADIDGDKLIADFSDQVKYISRNNNKDSYQKPVEELVADIKSNITYQYSKDQGLSNGDEITIMANLDNIKISDKYNVLMANASKPVLVSGIADDNFTDPFKYIEVKFEGTSPNISLTTKLADGAPEFMHTIEIVPAKTTGISDGEEVAVSLNFDKEAIKANYGVELNPTSKNFKANATGENSNQVDSEYIKTTANLDNNLLGDMKYKAGELIKQTILYKNIINVDNINYLGSFTGYKDDQAGDIKNRVFLVYEVETSERLPESNYQGSFKYYTFVEYQNVKKNMDGGKYYSQGPMTTDNQIFHKFFVESDYKYYQIEYQGFGFIDKALAKLGASLDGLTVTDENKTEVSKHFATSDGIVGEYEADNQRLSLKEDGSLIYQLDKAVHRGSYSLDGNKVSATIQGVNTDNPVVLNFESGVLKADEQGEFKAASFHKIESF